MNFLFLIYLEYLSFFPCPNGSLVLGFRENGNSSLSFTFISILILFSWVLSRTFRALEILFSWFLSRFILLIFFKTLFLSSSLNPSFHRGKVINLLPSLSMMFVFRKSVEKIPSPGTRGYGLVAGSAGKPNTGIYDVKGHPPVARVICAQENCEEKYCPLSPCDSPVAEKVFANLTNKDPRSLTSTSIDNGDGTFLVMNSHSAEREHSPGSVVKDEINTLKAHRQANEIQDFTHIP